MVARILLWVCFFVLLHVEGPAQAGRCSFKPPFFLMHFGKGSVQDVNTGSLTYYDRVAHSCPSDGHYTYTSYTSDCFRGDWHTLETDHTPGDVDGNMLIVNSAYSEGEFFTTRVEGFKANTTYQFGVWLMNVCKPSDKCPFPLLPNLIIRLQTPAGKIVAQFGTGQLPRVASPRWTQHRAQFTMPATASELILTMINTAPGGCGNDLAMDDITFQECVREDPATTVKTKKIPTVTAKKDPPVVQKKIKTAVSQAKPVDRNSVVQVPQVQNKVTVTEQPRLVAQKLSLVPVPLVLKQRTNKLVKEIKTPTTDLRLDLYDNGEIDGDTVSIYHNNVLILSRQALSQKPVSFRIRVDKNQPHHELVMVANNLGSIPPNTSLMIVTTKDKRYEVYISSSEQTNAKVLVTLQE
jgi:hypothetical protein